MQFEFAAASTRTLFSPTEFIMVPATILTDYANRYGLSEDPTLRREGKSGLTPLKTPASRFPSSPASAERFKLIDNYEDADSTISRL